MMLHMINYSIIIPHKDSQVYLDRCLKTIPQRDDVEIIVVDDNSCDFDSVRKIVGNFPKVALYNNEGFGAGGARNTGLLKAKGKWLLFADCDDYYVEGFLEELDYYVDSDYDVIYFNFNQYLEGKEKPVYEKVSNYIKECTERKISVDYVKYRNNTPWNKMIRHNLVEKKSIRFEEQPIGNDVFFSYQIGYYSKKHKVIDAKLYNYIVYKKSQTRKDWNEDKIKTFLANLQKYNGFVEFINHKEWTHGFPFLCFQLYKFKNVNRAFRILVYYFCHYNEIRKERNKYVDLLTRKA